MADLRDASRSVLSLALPLALALVALGAWVLASVSMKPVNRLRDAMRGMTPTVLDQRLPSAGEDREFRELIEVYNLMLGRLEQSFHQASRFSADAAHELKTPLTILQGRLEKALIASDNRAIQSDLAAMLDELGRLAGVTRKLLLLSQADAGRLALQRSPVDLSEWLEALVADAQMLIEEQTLTCAIAPALRIDGDALLLRQLLNNLISNAVRYCRPSGRIDVSARALPDGVEVMVVNDAEPITEADRARLFDRFYRGESARQRQIEGSGLGLSLAREIARAHGGELELAPSEAAQVRLRLWLPRSGRCSEMTKMSFIRRHGALG